MKTLFGFLTLNLMVLSCQKEDTPTFPNNSSHLKPNLSYGMIADIDVNEYTTKQIGTQIWMAENLSTMAYANDDSTPNATSIAEWSILTSETWVNYIHNDQFDDPFRKFNNWFSVNDQRSVFPTG